MCVQSLCIKRIRTSIFRIVELPWIYLWMCAGVATYIYTYNISSSKQSHSTVPALRKKNNGFDQTQRAILPSSPVLIRSAAERDVWFSYCVWKMCQFSAVHKEISSKSTNSSPLLNKKVFKLCLWVNFVFCGVLKWVHSKLICPPPPSRHTYPDISYVLCVFRWT